MDIGYALLLGVLQGVTEFLPISSSGHLVLGESLFHLQVADLQSFDIAVHFGTLLAIFVYFRKNIGRLLVALGGILARKHVEKEDKSLIGYLLVGTVPAVLVGLFFGDFIEEGFRGAKSVAVMLLVVAVFFVVAEYIKKRRKEAKIGLVQAVVIGCVQAIAIIPGISRSGSTIGAGLLQGVDREEAARFSFLLGAVAISAATALSLYKASKGLLVLPSMEVLGIGIVGSFIAGYLSVSFLMKFLKSHTLHIFSAYLLVLSFVVLLFV
ncbi:undecaprenyl-diphosphate phosphatase [Patescibacteria group bacterium]|nr:undecaprenyl-diphosphate phosphatase [Patescibacteria group bacterium]